MISFNMHAENVTLWDYFGKLPCFQGWGNDTFYTVQEESTTIFSYKQKTERQNWGGNWKDEIFHLPSIGICHLLRMSIKSRNAFNFNTGFTAFLITRETLVSGIPPTGYIEFLIMCFLVINLMTIIISICPKEKNINRHIPNVEQNIYHYLRWYQRLFIDVNLWW